MSKRPLFGRALDELDDKVDSCCYFEICQSEWHQFMKNDDVDRDEKDNIQAER